MDIGKSLTYITEDERWLTKLGIALLMSLLSLFIIPMFLLYGYVIGIVRNVMNGVERPLPEWDDLGGFLKDGFNLFIAILVYTSPLWILTCVVVFSTVGLSGLSELSEDAALASIFATFGVAACFGLIFWVGMLFIMPALMIQYARENSLGACFRFGEVIAIVRNHIGDIAVAVAVVLGATFVIGLVANIPCLGFLIALAAGPYIGAVAGHLYGQIAAKAGGAPKEEKFMV